METSYKGVLFLAENEGAVLCPYQDSVGVWTIGIGHTSGAGDPDPQDVDSNITPQEAIALFKHDLASYESDVNDVLTYASATQYQFDAAVSFHYNTGAISSANWVDAWNEGRLDEAAAEIMNWTEPPEVTERRQREQDLFASGDYDEPFQVSVWDTWPGTPRSVTFPPDPPKDWQKPAAVTDVCPTCGAPLPSHCSNCGTPLPTI